MEHIELHPGTYTLVNAQFTRYALDTKGGRAIAYPFIGSTSQQWSLKTIDGVCWHVQNVKSGLHLGLPTDAHIQNSLPLHEVKHKFGWHIKRHSQHDHIFSLYVPYSKQVVDMGPDKVKPGSGAFVYQDDAGLHQMWHLCRDLHLDVASALRAGHQYMLSSYSFAVSMTATSPSTEVYAVGDSSDSLNFRAVATDHGWAFQHVQSKHYVGVPHSVVPPDELVQISLVEKPFTWMIIPHHGDRQRFKICLPFTSLIISLGISPNGNMPVELDADSEDDTVWWHFEPCEKPSTSHTYYNSGRKGNESVLGPRDSPR